jgi:hypothetical protein
MLQSATTRRAKSDPGSGGMNRTRAQQRYRRQGYTFEISQLRNPLMRSPKTILIRKGASDSWREWRRYCAAMGETIRPICKHYIHNGGKP